MDTQALTNLQAALRAQGFRGDVESLASLLSKAKDETQERLAMSYWKAGGTPAQATLVANAVTHARKHSMKVIYGTSSPEHLILANRRSNHAIRLTTIDLVGKGVRLVFFSKMGNV